MAAAKRFGKQLERLFDKLHQQRGEQLRRVEADAWLIRLSRNQYPFIRMNGCRFLELLGTCNSLLPRAAI